MRYPLITITEDMTHKELARAMALNVETLRNTNLLTNGIVTTAKFNPSRFTHQVSTGTNWSVSTTLTALSGSEYEYTAGDTNETLDFTVSVLITKLTGGVAQAYVRTRTKPSGGSYGSYTQHEPVFYGTPTADWTRQAIRFQADVDAGDTIEISLAMESNDANAAMISRSSTTHAPRYTGISMYRV